VSFYLFFKEIKTNFFVDLKKYYAGMIDGDGRIIFIQKRLICALELTENAAFSCNRIVKYF
jgi:hypothetical protein